MPNVMGKTTRPPAFYARPLAFGCLV
jgi:hypothetical protein